MSKKKAILIFTLLAIIGLSTLAFFWLNSLPTATSRLEAEQEIYSVLFTYLISSERIINVEEYPLIKEYTTLSDAQECTAEECAQYIIDNLPKVKRSTLTDFQENNMQSYPLKNYFPPAIYELLNNPDKRQKTYWWQLSFSRIGFNRSLTQALVLVGDCRGDACFDNAGKSIYSEGDFFLLGKVNGKWVIQDGFRYWLEETQARLLNNKMSIMFRKIE